MRRPQTPVMMTMEGNKFLSEVNWPWILPRWSLRGKEEENTLASQKCLPCWLVQLGDLTQHSEKGLDRRRYQIWIKEMCLFGVLELPREKNKKQKKTEAAIWRGRSARDGAARIRSSCSFSDLWKLPGMSSLRVHRVLQIKCKTFSFFCYILGICSYIIKSTTRHHKVTDYTVYIIAVP